MSAQGEGGDRDDAGSDKDGGEDGSQARYPIFSLGAKQGWDDR
jgi:hypothetical protein